MTDRGERIFLIESDIGTCNGQLANSCRVMHIAEIDERGFVSVNNDIVIVGVAMNYAVAERCQIGSHGEHSLDQCRIGGEVEVIADPKSAFQVPLEFPTRA